MKLCLDKNVKLLNNEMINDNCGEKDVKTSENICDVSSSKRDSSSYSSSFVPSYHQSDKQQRSISDPRASLQGFASRTNPSNSSHRRSTVVCVPISDREQENEIILRVPYRKIQEHPSHKATSHDSIAVIRENSSYPIDEPKQESFYSNSDSDEQKLNQKGTTRIKLSLPITSTGKNARHRFQNRQIGDYGNETNVTGEFTLPTNPPITVTIEPQSNFNINVEKESSIHDDQICSPEHVHIRNERTSIDPSFKGSSTIVSYFMDLLKPSDNKLAMKLYGSRKGVLKERLRQQRAGHCIIHPCSNFRFVSFFF
jgi:hypothetical protein